MAKSHSGGESHQLRVLQYWVLISAESHFQKRWISNQNNTTEQSAARDMPHEADWMKGTKQLLKSQPAALNNAPRWSYFGGGSKSRLLTEPAGPGCQDCFSRKTHSGLLWRGIPPRRCRTRRKPFPPGKHFPFEQLCGSWASPNIDISRGPGRRKWHDRQPAGLERPKVTRAIPRHHSEHE